MRGQHCQKQTLCTVKMQKLQLKFLTPEQLSSNLQTRNKQPDER